VPGERRDNPIDAEVLEAKTAVIDPRRAIGAVGRQIEIDAGRDAQAGVERPRVTFLREAEEALVEVDRSLQVRDDERHVIESADLQLRRRLDEQLRRGCQGGNRQEKPAAIDW